MATYVEMAADLERSQVHFFLVILPLRQQTISRFTQM